MKPSAAPACGPSLPVAASAGQTMLVEHPGGGACFPSTHWSVVRLAGARGSPEAEAALARLCQLYWYPLYSFVRRTGHGPDEAQDLTQGFFARLIGKNYVGQADRERGRFRTFLLSALRHFLADQRDFANRQKRGGGQSIVSFDAATAEERYQLEPPDLRDPAALFDRRWATTLLENALRRLEDESVTTSRAAAFAELREFLIGDHDHGTYAEAAARLHTTPAALKMAVLRLRRRCRELIREEIAQTVSAPEQVEEEYRALASLLQR